MAVTNTEVSYDQLKITDNSLGSDSDVRAMLNPFVSMPRGELADTLKKASDGAGIQQAGQTVGTDASSSAERRQNKDVDNLPDLKLANADSGEDHKALRHEWHLRREALIAKEANNGNVNINDLGQVKDALAWANQVGSPDAARLGRLLGIMEDRIAAQQRGQSQDKLG